MGLNASDSGRRSYSPPNSLLHPSLKLAKILLLPLYHHQCTLSFLIPPYSAPSVLIQQTKTARAVHSLDPSAFRPQTVAGRTCIRP